MRHLIDTYIEADEPRKISPFDNMSLVELIVKSGIVNAINSHLGGLKGNNSQQDHQGASQRSGLLRKNVGLAGRDHRRPEGKSD
jgi:hypothetical protein